MPQDSMLPPPKRGVTSYIIGGLIVLIAGVCYWQFSGGEEENAAPPTPIENVLPQRQTVAEQNFVVSETRDASVDATPDAETQEPSTAQNRRSASAGGCNGTLNPAVARRYVSRHRGAVRSCYERRLKTINSLQGQVIVDLRVGTSGQVSGVRVRGSLRDPEVFSCIRNTVSRWQLPSPEGGCANLQVPFTFTPRL